MLQFDLLPDGSVVIEVVPRSGGSLNTVYEVRLADSEPVIVKRYSDRWRDKQAKEVHVYGLMAGLDGVPRVVGVDYERATTALTMLPGVPAWERPSRPDTDRAVYRRIGQFQAALHRIRMPAYGEPVTASVPDNVTYMHQRFSRQLADFRTAGGPVDVHDAIERRLAGADRYFAACAGAVLCHNDLHEGNVLVDDAGTVTGFIDVENAVAADPMTDLAKTLQFELSGSALKRAALFDGYGPLPPYGTERIALYRLYHALELWTWFAQIGETDRLPALLESLTAVLT